MNRIIKPFLYLIVTASNALSCSSQVPEQRHQQTHIDESSWPDIICDSANLENLVTDWKKDSLGCLGIRNQVIAECLEQQLQLNGKDQDEVIIWLGKPNKIHTENLFLGNLNEENNFILMDYYFEARCDQNGGLLPGSRCWLSIVIHPKTHKVVQVDKGCN